MVPGARRRLPTRPLRRALPGVGSRDRQPAPVRRHGSRLRDPEPADPRQHRRLPAQQQDLRRGQRLAARPVAGARHHQPIPGHHPRQPRRPQGRGRRDRAPRRSPQTGAGRRSDAVTRAVRQTDVRTHLGGRCRPRAAGRGAHQRRQRRRPSAHVRRARAHLPGICGIHAAELLRPPGHAHRRGRVRPAPRPEVRFRRRWIRHPHPADVAAGHLLAVDARPDAVGGPLSQRVPARPCPVLLVGIRRADRGSADAALDGLHRQGRPADVRIELPALVHVVAGRRRPRVSTTAQRDKVLWRNASELYGLKERVL